MKKFKQLIINSINPEITGTTIQRLHTVLNKFEGEMLWENKIPYGEEQIKKCLQDWLQGLCSAVQVPFYNCDIIAWYEKELGRKVKEPKSQKGISEEERWLNNYWKYCANALFDLLYK